MKRRLVVLGFLLFISSLEFGAEKPETSHLTFVNEYVRELAAVENIRVRGEEELKQGTKDGTFSTAIHVSTLMQLELSFQIDTLKGMRLNSPPGFEELIPNIIGFYEAKIALYQQLSDIGSAFIAGPEPGVDYGKLAAEMPKIRAKLDYLDQALFEATPLIFMTLQDLHPDSKDHVSHLIITRAERAKLIDDITNDFGSKLDVKDQNYTVSAAKVLKDALVVKGFKCSDDPWD